MATTAKGDVLINGRPYLIQRKSYRVIESPKSSPRFGGATAPEFLRGDNWTYWGQSDFLGMREDDWIADGPFSDGYGLDISSVAGQIKVAKKLEQSQADVNNTGGYVAFPVGTTRVWFIGKTNGTGYRSENGSSWTSAANVLAASVNPTSYGEFKGTHYVGGSNGNLYSIGTGTTFTAIVGPVATPVYVLGSYKGKLWIGYSNALYTFDGITTFTPVFTGKVDGLPIIGAVGNGVLYFLTQGPNARLLMTDENQLHHLANLSTDFLPKAVLHGEALTIFGHGSDDTNTVGQVWRLDKAGLFPIFDFGDFDADYGIRSAIAVGDVFYWGANSVSGGNPAGLGVYDPGLDLFEDSQMGFYVSSTAAGVGTAVIHGLAQFGGTIFCGIQGSGIFKQTTPGTFRFVSSLFDGNTKNISKRWGFAELQHTALTDGQTITLSTSIDGLVTEDEWDTSDVNAETGMTMDAPPGYRSPFIQYVLEGDANGDDLSILDISLAYIEASENPKKEWDMVLVLEGGPGYVNQLMRDGELNQYTAMESLAELNGLWNTITTFDDIDGTEYDVVFKAPAGRVDDVIKEVSDGSVTDALIFYRVHLVELTGASTAADGGTSTYGNAVYA